MIQRNAYGQGFDAGLGIGQYEGVDVPDCPFEVGSKKAKHWHAGYQDGLDAKLTETNLRERGL